MSVQIPVAERAEAQQLAARHTGGKLGPLVPLLVDQLVARERAEQLGELAELGRAQAASFGLRPVDVIPVLDLRVYFGPSAEALEIVEGVRYVAR